jgi:hypothetical protein
MSAPPFLPYSGQATDYQHNLQDCSRLMSEVDAFLFA